MIDLGKLGVLLVASVHRLVVSQCKLDVYGLYVAGGIDSVVHVDDVRVVEAAHNMGNDAHLADVGQELVAKTLSLGGTRHKAGDVDELGHGRDDLCRRNQDDLVQPGIGDVDDADIGLDGAERVVRGLGRCTCECREDC